MCLVGSNHTNSLYEYKQCNEAQEFCISDLNGSFVVPVGVHYMIPECQNEHYFTPKLVEMISAVETCSQCLRDGVECMASCNECFQQQSVCDVCIGRYEY